MWLSYKDTFKEWLNENWKGIVTRIAYIIAGIVIAVSVMLSVGIRQIDRANSETAAVRNELQSARKELAKAGATISGIRKYQSELTEGLRSDNKELSEIIKGLEVIRDEVYGLEVLLDNYYADYDSDNNIYGNQSLR